MLFLNKLPNMKKSEQSLFLKNKLKGKRKKRKKPLDMIPKNSYGKDSVLSIPYSKPIMIDKMKEFYLTSGSMLID